MTRVARDIYRVPTALGSNIYMLEDAELALVDAGLPGSGRAVLDYIRVLGRQPEELRRIFLTHGHPDHYGGAPELRAATGAAVWAHPGDVRRAKGGTLIVQYPATAAFPQAPVDELFRDGQVLPVLGGLRVFHLPGHTPGSVGLFAESRGLVFTGDTLLSDGRFFSQPLPFPGTDLRHYRRSLHRLAELEFQAACPGHGQPMLDEASLRLKELLKLLYDEPAPVWWRVLRNIPGLARLGIRVRAAQLRSQRAT